MYHSYLAHSAEYSVSPLNNNDKYTVIGKSASRKLCVNDPDITILRYSVLFRNVTICEGAEVEDCVIMNDTVVGEGSELKYVILDKDVTVRPGSKLCGTKRNPIIVKRGETV